MYALCRLADDIVDDQHGQCASLTAEIAAELAAFADRLPYGAGRRRQRRPGHSRPWCNTVIAADIDPECFDRFFAAMAMDLHTTSYETWDDLCGYMDGSAAVIGEMMLPVLAPGTDVARNPARALGFAFQLTNFLRDVGEDLDLGRVYLPQAGSAAVRRRHHRSASVTPEWREFMAFQFRRNRELYRPADTGITAAARPDRRNVLAQRGCCTRRSWTGSRTPTMTSSARRVRVPTWRKAATAARFLLSGTPNARPTPQIIGG